MSPPLKCPSCQADLLSTDLWRDSIYPTWKCGRISFRSAGQHGSMRCTLRSILLPSVKRETYQQQQLRLKHEHAIAQAEKELA